eukprot:jgi/Botrbrau1/4235/Bobra.0044s0030.1
MSQRHGGHLHVCHSMPVGLKSLHWRIQLGGHLTLVGDLAKGHVRHADTGGQLQPHGGPLLCPQAQLSPHDGEGHQAAVILLQCLGVGHALKISS